MRFAKTTILAFAVASFLVGFMQKSAVAQTSGKYISSWTSDETYPNIQFRFSRVKDPGGTGDDYFRYQFKNNSKKKLRVSYVVSGAGLNTPRKGEVIAGPDQTAGGASRGMFLNGTRGGQLTSRITKLEHVGNEGDSAHADFKKFEKELSAEKKKELTNKDISRILKDNRKEIVAKAKHFQGIVSTRKNKSTSTNPIVSSLELSAAKIGSESPSDKPKEPSSKSKAKKDSRYRVLNVDGGHVRLYLDGRADYRNKWVGTWTLNSKRLILKMHKKRDKTKTLYFDGLYGTNPRNPNAFVGQLKSFNGRITDNGAHVYYDNRIHKDGEVVE